VKKNIIYLFIASSMLFSACSTDLDVNGDWKETMVVYGLLDQTQTKQYIKVNKAFLGPQSGLVMAQIKDSAQYANALTVKLVRVSDNSEVLLRPDNSIPKEDGVFYGPDQANAIYSNVDINGNTVPLNLVSSTQYKLVIQNGETGKVVTSQTPLIADFPIVKPNASTPFFNFIFANSPNYRFLVEWTSSKNARIYQMIVRFNYVDSLITGNVNKSIDWVFPAQKTLGLLGGETMTQDFKGQDFLSFIGNKLCNNCPVSADLIARRAVNVDLLLIAGADDLSTFIDVNKPSTGIIQTKPEFTNINGGLGLFSARYNKAPFTRPLAVTTTDSLACGQYTKRLKFLNAVGNLPNCP